MQWLRSHLYVVASLGAILLLLLGVFFVLKRSSVAPNGISNLRAWGGVGTKFSNLPVEGPNQPGPREDLYTEVRSGPPFYYATSSSPITQAQATGADQMDFEEILSMLSHPQQNVSVKSDEGSLNVYSFIPTGLLSVSSGETERTPTQQALYSYANDAASNIQAYEDASRNAPQILKDQFEDRTNPAKNAALVRLATALGGVGDALLVMEEVPTQIQSAHEKLAESYQEMGKNLARIPSAKDDKGLVELMLAYNATVETFTKNYVSLATTLSAFGVVFKQDDPGSIFTFNNNTSGL